MDLEKEILQLKAKISELESSKKNNLFGSTYNNAGSSSISTVTGITSSNGSHTHDVTIESNSTGYRIQDSIRMGTIDIYYEIIISK